MVEPKAKEQSRHGLLPSRRNLAEAGSSLTIFPRESLLGKLASFSHLPIR